MELTPLLMAGSIVSILFSLVALGLSIWTLIEIQATKRATHTVIPMTPDSTMSKLEKRLENIANGSGADQSDLNRGLFDAGVDPEDLV